MIITWDLIETVRGAQTVHIIAFGLMAWMPLGKSQLKLTLVGQVFFVVFLYYMNERMHKEFISLHRLLYSMHHIESICH